ncbi:glycoside hydrolase superfamily [Tribonema minus]|uniref:Glycoside hydrolase superfamily n=1 Tax=Tribonema minus TaxID=303371 RepID=A0A836CAG2_9STRA|nr:glycoside hydrolase superfamily [Tribonema minus]
MLAKDLSALRLGFNLGQTFDNADKSTDPARVKPLLKAYRDKGFTHVRIPVSWRRSDDYFFNKTKFMTDLMTAVQYSVDIGLAVILDAHHEQWLHERYDDSQAVRDKFKDMWKDIAGKFRTFSPDKLVFEVLNEPQVKFGDTDDCMREPFISRTRAINQAGYDGIRSATATHLVLAMLPGGGVDPCLAVAVHSYTPNAFCLPSGSNDVFPTVDAVRAFLSDRAAKTRRYSDASGIYVMMNEFGVGAEDQSRRGDPRVAAFYYETAKNFLQRGIALSVWDDSGSFAVRDDRGTWVYGLADAMIKGARDATTAPAASRRRDLAPIIETIDL